MPDQCDGTADAAYHSGKHQACAWAHPFYALASRREWKIKGGDTLLIGNGSYPMGAVPPNVDFCHTSGAWDCHLPPLPSGPAVDHPTRLAGREYGSGCSHKPELWGTRRTYSIVDLTRSVNVSVECLEITDHANCGWRHATMPCPDKPPFGDWGSDGIRASDASNVTLRNLNIHGMAEFGILGGRFHNLTVENVRIAGNASGGWNFDIAGNENSDNTGELKFSGLTIEWNGCVEHYPDGAPTQCWGQQTGGYGDGIGEALTGGGWYFVDSVIRYNTQDGLDLLYLKSDSSVRIERVLAYGNAGNQVKAAGNVTVINSVIAGSCASFFQQPFSILKGFPRDGSDGYHEADNCRAFGDALLLVPYNGNMAAVYNSTITGEGGALLSVHCHGEGCLSASTKVDVRNNIFRGFPSRVVAGKMPGAIWVEGEGVEVRADHNLFYGVKPLEAGQCGVGTSYNCDSPAFVNDTLAEGFDLSLRPSSAAIGLGTPIPSVVDDFKRVKRPQGGAYDMGAYQFTGTPDPGRPHRLQEAFLGGQPVHLRGIRVRTAAWAYQMLGKHVRIKLGLLLLLLFTLFAFGWLVLHSIHRFRSGPAAGTSQVLSTHGEPPR